MKEAKVKRIKKKEYTIPIFLSYPLKCCAFQYLEKEFNLILVYSKWLNSIWLLEKGNNELIGRIFVDTDLKVIVKTGKTKKIKADEIEESIDVKKYLEAVCKEYFENKC